MAVVYTVAFTKIYARAGSEGFVFYLMLGLLAWTFFANSAGNVDRYRSPTTAGWSRASGSPAPSCRPQPSLTRPARRIPAVSTILKQPAMPREHRVNGIASRPRHLAHDHPLLTKQPIDQRGLACIWAPDDRDRDLRGLQCRRWIPMRAARARSRRAGRRRRHHVRLRSRKPDRIRVDTFPVRRCARACHRAC